MLKTVSENVCISSYVLIRDSGRFLIADFRFQEAGWRDLTEYKHAVSEIPERWKNSELVACLRSKKTGYWMYFGYERGEFGDIPSNH